MMTVIQADPRGTSAMSEGQPVRLFMVNGTQVGLCTSEIMNWAGHVIDAPGHYDQLCEDAQTPF